MGHPSISRKYRPAAGLLGIALAMGVTAELLHKGLEWEKENRIEMVQNAISGNRIALDEYWHIRNDRVTVKQFEIEFAAKNGKDDAAAADKLYSASLDFGDTLTGLVKDGTEQASFVTMLRFWSEIRDLKTLGASGLHSSGERPVATAGPDVRNVVFLENSIFSHDLADIGALHKLGKDKIVIDRMINTEIETLHIRNGQEFERAVRTDALLATGALDDEWAIDSVKLRVGVGSDPVQVESIARAMDETEVALQRFKLKATLEALRQAVNPNDRDKPPRSPIVVSPPQNQI